MTRVLLVCLGNICRSPMAEGILRDLAKKNNIEIELDSAGTGNSHIGQAPDPRSISTALQFGIDISQLRARQFTVKDFNNFDIIYVMDKSNQADVLKLARSSEDENKVHLFLDLIKNNKSKDVPDPWFGNLDVFNDVFHLLYTASENYVAQYNTVKS